jgi:hypothetical protein
MQQSTVSRWMQMQGDEKEVEWTENGSTSHGEWGTIVRIEGGGATTAATKAEKALQPINLICDKHAALALQQPSAASSMLQGC